ncbi:putative KHDC1-like protein, partial [Diceros bicornis minor]|uniref:putative KHDC1-like protein n=1 Tax=Diceros bicornis minor TaxID=77932 RepID=UPI0026F35FC1
KKPWWTTPEDSYLSLVCYMAEDKEEHILGFLDTDFHCMEVHKHTLIQLEGCSQQWARCNSVTIVGPPQARQWLFHIIWNPE